MASLLTACYLNPGSPITFRSSSPCSYSESSPAHPRGRSVSVAASAQLPPQVTDKAQAIVQSGDDMLEICRVINGMWQTSGGWGKIDPIAAVDAMLRHADAGFTTFDMADIYGPAEELYGMFLKKVRQERGEELASTVKGLTKWVPRPMKMTRAYVEGSVDRSRKRMDVKALDMLQFHWWDYFDGGYLDALKHLTDLKEEGAVLSC